LAKVAVAVSQFSGLQIMQKCYNFYCSQQDPFECPFSSGTRLPIDCEQSQRNGEMESWRIGEMRPTEKETSRF